MGEQIGVPHTLEGEPSIEMKPNYESWDKEMRVRLEKRLRDHMDELILDWQASNEPKEEVDAMVNSFRSEYGEEIAVLQNGERARKKQPAYDIFATEFQNMAREGLATFGSDMEYYEKFREMFFEDRSSSSTLEQK